MFVYVHIHGPICRYIVRVPAKAIRHSFKSLKHCIDIVHDVPPEDVDREQVKGILKAKRFQELPEPLRLKNHHPSSINRSISSFRKKTARLPS